MVKKINKVCLVVLMCGFCELANGDESYDGTTNIESYIKEMHKDIESASGITEVLDEESARQILIEKELFIKENTYNADSYNVEHVNGYYRAREIGRDETFIFLIREQDAISEGVIGEVTNLQEWIEEYDGDMCTESSSFIFGKDWSYTYSSPTEALHSYWEALWRCDLKEILMNCDPSFVKYIKRTKKYNLLAEPSVFRNDGMTRVVPLLEGKCVLDEKEYRALFYRREFPDDPVNNRISFHWDFFVYVNGSYHLSYEPATSQFGKMDSLFNFGSVGDSGLYYSYVNKLSETSMPKEFYILSEAGMSGSLIKSAGSGLKIQD